MITEITLFLLVIAATCNTIFCLRIIRQIEEEIAELDGVLEGLIDALREDADADYQHRIDRMFQYLTEDLEED